MSTSTQQRLTFDRQLVEGKPQLRIAIENRAHAVGYDRGACDMLRSVMESLRRLAKSGEALTINSKEDGKGETLVVVVIPAADFDGQARDE
jgi:hypothetical protein